VTRKPHKGRDFSRSQQTGNASAASPTAAKTRRKTSDAPVAGHQGADELRITLRMIHRKTHTIPTRSEKRNVAADEESGFCR
jgi:hypothetical protein